MTYPTRVRVVEVGPRDGLQNEASTGTVEAAAARASSSSSISAG